MTCICAKHAVRADCPEHGREKRSGLEPLLPNVPESPEVLRRVIRDAIRYAMEGRESHILWAEHLEAHANGDVPCDACTPEVVETAGDASVQREWVRKYDVILAALRAPLAPLLIEAVAKIGDEEERKSRVRNAQHALRYREEARAAEGER